MHWFGDVVLLLGSKSHLCTLSPALPKGSRIGAGKVSRRGRDAKHVVAYMGVRAGVVPRARVTQLKG